jgi:hypothetical protein
MDPSQPAKTPLTRLVLFMVCLSIAGILIAGIMYGAANPPVQNALVPPANSADPVLLGSKGDTSPDGTNCHNVYNLQEEDRNNFAAPTVVDINEANGNLLVRGPLPLIIRDGADNTAGCRNKADWQFAYDNLNAMIKAGKGVAPVYLPASRKMFLNGEMQSFDLANYHVIVISLLNHADNTAYFDIENAAFGQKYSQCSGAIQDGTLSGQPANLIWSSVEGCADDYGVCHRLLTKDDPNGGTCSYTGLIDEMNSLMAEKDPSGKKRLIYYHCTHGTDRTGMVTMGYLMKTDGLSYPDAFNYTQNLGQETTPHPRTPKDTLQRLAGYYCRAIGGTNCPANAGSTDAAVIAGTPAPTLIPAPGATPEPTATVVPVQTAVPDKPYNPAVSGGVNY